MPKCIRDVNTYPLFGGVPCIEVSVNEVPLYNNAMKMLTLKIGNIIVTTAANMSSQSNQPINQSNAKNRHVV